MAPEGVDTSEACAMGVLIMRLRTGQRVTREMIGAAKPERLPKGTIQYRAEANVLDLIRELAGVSRVV